MPTTSKDRPDSRLLMRILSVIGGVFAVVTLILFVRSAPRRSPDACIGAGGGPPRPAECVGCHVSPHRDGAGYQLRRVDAASGIIETVSSNAALRNGDGIVRDADGGEYGASPLGHVVWRREPGREAAEVIAGAALGGRPVRGYGGDGGPALGAKLNAPSSVAVDGEARVYIADALNNRVRCLSSDGIIETVAGNGKGGFGPAGLRAVETAIEKPLSVAFDGSGGLLIAHGTGRRGRVLRLHLGSGLTETVIGGGEASLGKGDGRPALEAVLKRPVEVTVDEDSGDIYVAESRPVLRHWNVGACASCHRLP